MSSRRLQQPPRDGVEDDAVDVIVTVIGGEQSARAILDGGGLVGTRSSESPPPNVPIDFVDWPFQLIDPDVDRHLDLVEAHQPEYAVAPDVDPDFDLDSSLAIARQLDAHADTVLMVPKTVNPDAIPDRYRVALPFRNNFDTRLFRNTYADFRGRPVHILGGNPTDHFELVDRFRLDVRSVDTPVLLTWADGGRVFIAQKRGGDAVDHYLIQRVIEESLHPERTYDEIHRDLRSFLDDPEVAADDTLRQLLTEYDPIREFIRENPRAFIDLIGAEFLEEQAVGVQAAVGVPSFATLLRSRAARIEFSVTNIRQAWNERAVTVRRDVAPGRGPPPPQPEDLVEEELFDPWEERMVSREERVERFLESTLEEELGQIERAEPEPGLDDFREFIDRKLNNPGNPGFKDLSDEAKTRRLLRPREGDEWPGTWGPHNPGTSFVPMWRNAEGQEIRLAERREGEPIAQVSTGESFAGLRRPELHDVLVDYMEDHPE